MNSIVPEVTLKVTGVKPVAIMVPEESWRVTHMPVNRYHDSKSVQ